MEKERNVKLRRHTYKTKESSHIKEERKTLGRGSIAYGNDQNRFGSFNVPLNSIMKISERSFLLVIIITKA